VTVLETIRGPQDLRNLDHEKLTTLADEIRKFLIAAVAKTGGHLGPNLGAVELTIALHRVFDSPDRLRYRPPVIRPQTSHWAGRRLRLAEAAWWTVGLPVSG
jgi:hypothetical protein